MKIQSNIEKVISIQVEEDSIDLLNLLLPNLEELYSGCTFLLYFNPKCSIANWEKISLKLNTAQNKKSTPNYPSNGGIYVPPFQHYFIYENGEITSKPFSKNPLLDNYDFYVSLLKGFGSNLFGIILGTSLNQIQGIDLLPQSNSFAYAVKLEGNSNLVVQSNLLSNKANTNLSINKLFDALNDFLKFQNPIQTEETSEIITSKEKNEKGGLLENSALLFENTFNENSNCLMILKVDEISNTQEIAHINWAFEKLTGYKPEDLLGKSPNILTGIETDIKELIRLEEHYKKGIPGTFNLLNYKKDGKSFWNKLTITPLKNEHGKISHWLGSILDITLIKKQQNDLIASENKFRNLVQNASLGILMIGKKGFVFVNETICNLTQYDETELYHIPIQNIIHPGDLTQFIQKLDDLMTGLVQETNQEIRLISKSGDIIHIDIFGSKTLFQGEPTMMGSVIDRTNKKLSEEKIRKFSHAIQQSGTSIIITDLDGNIEYVNPAFTKASGYTEVEVIGKNPRILKSGLSAPETHNNLWEKLKNNEQWKGIFCNKRKNGELYFEQATISPVFDKEGNKTNYIGVKEDITQLIELEKEKEKLVDELMKNYKDLKQFSFIISHNLRAPLSNLLGIIDLVDPNTINDETLSTLFNGFKKSTLKLDETVNDLNKSLVLRETTLNKYEPINFEEIIEKVKTNLSTQILNSNANIICSFTLLSDNFLLIKSYLENIFLNLIANAIKFSKPNISPKIEITTFMVKNNLHLQIKDNGIGMDINKVKDRLFGLYQKFSKESNSKGLGLYLVKSHVLAMNGKITAKSEIGEGTTFEIIFER
ncbi:MAG: PAS domain S-box protein [Bacteroidia bacterium]|nr:PAS domain S-box protein [Bacteroidia bacterium]MCF8425319.1 PAS domain S-box protein [Bacteroidia bacterium]MCF8446104.1 PAS domain S-box protein [Bacteroidia bacterium]